jgi:hypothetical protein
MIYHPIRELGSINVVTLIQVSCDICHILHVYCYLVLL